MRVTVQGAVAERVEDAGGVWLPRHVARLAEADWPEAALITARDLIAIDPSMTLWDIWPVQRDDGTLADVNGSSLWIMLSAPRSDNPDDRHDQARMRLLALKDDVWSDCGNVLPDGFAPGSREWSGSTRLDEVTGDITLWFTATGRRGAGEHSFEQRLFHVRGQLDLSGATLAITGWSDLCPLVENDGSHYADLEVNQGIPGRIKGFRDPYWFRDPADGQGYFLFTGSKAADQSESDYDGVIGIAAASDVDGHATARLLPPLIDADGLSNELERPHVFVKDGLYYLFWSTQSSVFAPTGPVGPTALYGMAAPSLFGPYQPLNGTGLVLANPRVEPKQAYAWQVLPSLDVVAFVDYWGLEGRDIASDPTLKAAHFGGTIAPMTRIALEGYTSRIIAA